MPSVRGGAVSSHCSKCRRYCRLGATFLFSHIGLCGLVVGYSIVGAFTFEALEAGHESKKRELMVKEREHMVEELWNLTAASTLLAENNWTLSATVALQEFEMILVKAVRKEGYDGKEDSPLQWSFSGALLYSIIVITTIGYGNIAPKTQWGKVVTILYAIIGIPLLLLCLSNIGDAMAHSFKFIYWKVCCYLCVKPKRRRKPRTIYRQQTFRPAASIRPPPSPPDSPPIGSSSSYYTAPTTTGGVASPELTSPVSSSVTSPNASPPPFSLHHVSPPVSQHPSFKTFNDQRIDISLIPIISNKYVLQAGDDLPIDMPLSAMGKTDPPLPPHSIYNMASNHSRDYRCPPHPPLRATDRFPWRNNLDTDVDLMDDEESMADSTEPDEEVKVPMWLCLALVVSYICGGAVLFTFWEKWNFLDSSYFCFVTLSTIGFGDLVPGTAVISDDNQLTLGLCSLYLLFGMALLAMSFNLVQEEVTKSVKCVGRRIGIISDDEDN